MIGSIVESLLKFGLRIFHPENSLVAAINLWLISLSKICLFSNLAKLTKNFLKGSEIYGYFFSSALVVVELLTIEQLILYSNAGKQLF